MQRHLKTFVMLGMSAWLMGCATSKTVVIDSQSDIVRLSNDVRGHVYVWRNGSWEKTGDKVTLPEGWYAGPMKAK